MNHISITGTQNNASTISQSPIDSSTEIKLLPVNVYYQ